MFTALGKLTARPRPVLGLAVLGAVILAVLGHGASAKLLVGGTEDRGRLRVVPRAGNHMVDARDVALSCLAAVLPFHRAVVADPVFTATGPDGGQGTFGVHTRWIETEWNGDVEPFAVDGPAGEPAAEEDAIPRQTVVVEVDGRRVEVSLPGQLTPADAGGTASAGKKPRPRKRGAASAVSGDAVTALEGVVTNLAVQPGAAVPAGATICDITAT